MHNTMQLYYQHVEVPTSFMFKLIRYALLLCLTLGLIFVLSIIILPIDLKRPQPGEQVQTAFMLRQGVSTSTWVSIYEVSPALICAIVKAEDRNFFKHNGIDFASVFRSIKKGFEDGKPFLGASTITQQLSKMLHGPSRRNYFRKVFEAWYAMKLEFVLSKVEILEYYLNTVKFGNNIWGVKNAANYYFSQSPTDVSVIRSIVLSGFIASPESFKDEVQWNRLNKLYERVNYQLQTSGYYDADARVLNHISFPQMSTLDFDEGSQFDGTAKEVLSSGCGIDKELKNENQ